MSEQGALLAFDCSGGACSAAVAVEGEIVAELFETMARGQAEALLPQIRAVMAAARLDFGGLDFIVTTTGPGSFTGLRIGLAAARGIAFAAERPILALTAFEAYLGALDPKDTPGRDVAVLIDSRRGALFAQLFGAGLAPGGAPVSLERDQVAAWLPPGPVLVTGDACGLPDLPRRAGLAVAAGTPRIRAADLARIAWRLRDGDAAARPPVPLYLRLPDVTLPSTAPCA